MYIVFFKLYLLSSVLLVVYHMIKRKSYIVYLKVFNAFNVKSTRVNVTLPCSEKATGGLKAPFPPL